ncbi:MAG: hypothetical protein LBG15_11515 [Dysgonamonadaceae bacterium]|nr:hypothetical protein [Dysgonamonadaceae bacterium]
MRNRKCKMERSPERAKIISDGCCRVVLGEHIVFCPVRDSMLVENGVYFHRHPSR